MGYFRRLAAGFLLLSVPLAAQAPKPQRNTTPSDGTTALHLAVRNDDLPGVQRLLRSGANPGAANRYGITPLSLAAVNGNAAMIGLLLRAGADPKAGMPGGQTVLMTAARTGNAEAVKLLLAHGCDPNAKEDTNGETALMWAAAENHAEAVQALIARGADVNARSMQHEYKTDRFGLEGVLTILPRGNWTPLMYAAREGAPKAARVLADAGAMLNSTDPDGTTALVIAIINGHYDTAAALLEKGADPNIADSAGMAALYAAVDMNTLAEVFGHPPRKSTDELTAVGLMKKLLDRGATPDARLKASTLYRAHTPGERILGEGATPLMRAARNGDSAAMRLLIERGADPSAEQKNHTTALMLASGQGRGLGTFADEVATESQMLEAVKILLDHHVDVNAANDAGQTALHFAALSMDSVVELLVKNGANLRATDKQNRTPLDMASGKGGPGRAGQAASPRPSTIALLQRLMGMR